MEKINTPFGFLDYVGDLLSNSYPTTVIYTNTNHQPIVIEWLDEDINGNDIFIMYQSYVENLMQFCNGAISHFELINQAVEKNYFEFAGSINENKFKKIKFNQIDKSSLPNELNYFDSSYSLDFEIIAKVFNIQIRNNKNKEDYFQILKKRSKDVNAGLFRLHILEGKKIGHGTADTKVLGQLLTSFEDLYHEIALDYITGVDRKINAKNINEDVLISDMASTEIYILEAASFSIYLKSKVDTIIENKTSTVSDEIFHKIDKLISQSTNKNELENIKNDYSEKTLNKLISFNEIILNNKIVVDLEYYNTYSDIELRNIINPADAHSINNNIESYSKISQSTLLFTGKFTNLNTKTLYFVFLSNEGFEISGYVFKLISENMISFNFTSLYNINVTQITDSTLNYKNKVNYILESCLENNQQKN